MKDWIFSFGSVNNSQYVVKASELQGIRLYNGKYYALVAKQDSPEVNDTTRNDILTEIQSFITANNTVSIPDPDPNPLPIPTINLTDAEKQQLNALATLLTKLDLFVNTGE